MAGMTLRVVPRQALNFTHLGASGTETRVLIGKIPSADYCVGELIVRVHNRSMSAGQSVAVSVVRDAQTDEDPANSFVDSTAISGGSISVTSSSPSDNGKFSYTKTTAGLGGAVAVGIVATQNGTANTQFMLEMSADLTLKDCDEAS